jgi:nucleotide-binding universal stress UspA family protein
MKVLVTTDGSDAAIRGAHRALELLQPGIEVVLAMVIPEREDPMMTASGFAGPLMTEEEATADFAESVEGGQAALQRTVDALNASELTEGDTLATRLIPSGDDAAGAIVTEAERTGADLIVIGSSGKGAWRRLFGGSVSEKVAREAPCPVLISPPQATDD